MEIKMGKVMLVSKFKQLSILGTFLLLAACGGVPEKQDRAAVEQDSAPEAKPDVANIPDAVPKHEPLSKYGNPAHYDVFGVRYYTLTTNRGYSEKGTASWYGTKFHGRRTSSGEPYDMYAMTAAHKTLPLPSYVEVTNLDNGKKIIVRVNDRGPFHEDRLIDLSYSAATKLDIVAKGTGSVAIRAISPGELITADVAQAPVEETTTPVIADEVQVSLENTTPEVKEPLNIYMQVGAFSSADSAEQFKTKLQQQIGDAVLVTPFLKLGEILYRVRIGPLAGLEYGDALGIRLLDLGYVGGHIVVE
jgi:peptidoglycan lytic transglycosylase